MASRRAGGASGSTEGGDRWTLLESSQLMAAIREFRSLVEPRGGFRNLIGGCCSCGIWLSPPTRVGRGDFDFHMMSGDDQLRDQTCADAPAMETAMNSGQSPRWDDDKDEFGEAGAPCSICCSDLRTNTHFAVPCRHAACESCWATWLEQHDTCMICAKPVRSTARFSQRLAPPSPAEAACDPGATASGGGAAAAAIAALNNDLEGALAALVRALVSARSALGGVAGRLDEMAAHLDPPRLRLMPPEARASVAAVEASALEELLGDARPGDAAPWQAIRSSVAGVDQALARVGGVLDDMPAGQGAARPSLAPALEVMQALLLDTSPRILTGQWRPTVLAPPHAARSGAPGAGAPDTRRGARGAGQEALARVVCEERLQRVVDLLDLSGALEAETARWAGEEERALAREARGAGGALQALLPELELMAIRLDSCFERD